MRKKFSSPVGEENIFLTCWRLQLHSCAVILCSTSGKILYSIENSISISSPPAFFILYCTFTKAHPSVHCQASLMMDFFALLWSKNGHFRRDSVEERWRRNVDCKGLGLAIPKRGVSFLCDKYWRRYTVWQSAMHILHFTLNVGPWSFLLSWCQFCM